MRYLLIAHQTADSTALRRHVRSIARSDPDARFVLVVPATPTEHLSGWIEGEAIRAALHTAERATAAFEVDGITLADARVGDANPLYAIQDAFIGEDFDQVIISTHSSAVSRWLHIDLVTKATRALAVPVVHVEADSEPDPVA